VGSEVFNTAYKLNLTFYNSAYLTEKKKTDSILVTDDKKLAKAAQNLGIQTMSNMTLARKMTQNKP
jgi:predicted nucleic acid-binding protein